MRVNLMAALKPALFRCHRCIFDGEIFSTWCTFVEIFGVTGVETDLSELEIFQSFVAGIGPWTAPVRMKVIWNSEAIRAPFG